MTRFITYFRRVGVEPERLRAFTEVKAVLTIRNCFMHASGVLDESRDAEEVRRLVAEKLYLGGNRTARSQLQCTQ
jgi:hypothetical protein